MNSSWSGEQSGVSKKIKTKDHSIGYGGLKNSVRVNLIYLQVFFDHSCTLLLPTKQASSSLFSSDQDTYYKFTQHTHKACRYFFTGCDDFKTYPQILSYFFSEGVESNSPPFEYGLALVTHF